MPRGYRGTQMEHLPVEHARGNTKAGTLCGRGRKQGALIASSPEHVNCRGCLKKMAQSDDPELLAATLYADDARALRMGVDLDRDELVNVGLVRRAYRTNRHGQVKFCGRRTKLGRAVAELLTKQHEASRPAAPDAVALELSEAEARALHSGDYESAAEALRARRLVGADCDDPLEALRGTFRGEAPPKTLRLTDLGRAMVAKLKKEGETR